ncbi:MAG TPA: hypothetical protein VMF10_02140 [Candidatus Aquilonibacter sp.]|nr:hypothetical protein [Candidatus Aquilonibacter sp.]
MPADLRADFQLQLSQSEPVLKSAELIAAIAGEGIVVEGHDVRLIAAQEQ